MHWIIILNNHSAGAITVVELWRSLQQVVKEKKA